MLALLQAIWGKYFVDFVLLERGLVSDSKPHCCEDLGVIQLWPSTQI